ncbi:MAG: hypothetical protein KJP04_01450, partial [Arenicella sp.]|nr:hypothetical protein [Arenicella sp.]
MTLRALHKWLSIIIGLQVLIWVTSGMIISLLDQQIVSGRSTKQAAPANQLLGNVDQLVSLNDLNLDYEEAIVSVRLEQVFSKLVYRIRTARQTRSYDARTGTVFMLDQQQADQIALASYRGPGLLNSSELMLDGSEEVPDAGAVWRIAFDDGIATRVYLSALDGTV